MNKFKNFYEKLVPGDIPQTGKKIVFNDDYNDEIGLNVLPKNLQSITFGRYYNKKIKPGVLPENLQSLTFGTFFNQPLELGVLPSNLQSIAFGICFNQPLELGVLPSNLQSITFGTYFSQKIIPGTIPASVKSIRGVYQSFTNIQQLINIKDVITNLKLDCSTIACHDNFFIDELINVLQNIPKIIFCNIHTLHILTEHIIKSSSISEFYYMGDTPIKANINYQIIHHTQLKFGDIDHEFGTPGVKIVFLSNQQNIKILDLEKKYHESNLEVLRIRKKLEKFKLIKQQINFIKEYC